MNDDTRAVKTARWLSYLIGFILILLPFHEFLAVWLGSNVGHLDLIRIWKEILLVLVLPAVLWLAWRSPPLRYFLYKSWITRLYGFYILLHLVLGFWALNRHEVNSVALIYALLINLRFIGFFLVCLVVAAYDDWLREKWLPLVLVPAAVVVVFGLIQKFLLPADFLRHFGYGSKTIPPYQTVDSNAAYPRVQSTLRGANPLGAYLVVIATSILAGLKNRNLMKPLLVLASLAVLFYTYSRSAWVGLGLAILTLIYLAGRRPSARIIYAAMAVVIVLAAGLYGFRNNQSVQDAILHTSNTSHKQSSNAVRNSALVTGLKDVAHQPLGRGPGTAGPASFRNTGQPARIAEDYYLQIGQEVGVIGLATFLAINALVAWRLWLNRHSDLARVLLAAAIGIGFINLVSHAWADDTLSLLWWGLAGVATAPAILKAKNKGHGKLQKA